MTKHKEEPKEEVAEKPKKVKHLTGDERLTGVLEHLNKHGFTFPEELHKKEEKED